MSKMTKAQKELIREARRTYMQIYRNSFRKKRYYARPKARKKD